MYDKYDIIRLFDSTQYWGYHVFGEVLLTQTPQRIAIIQKNTLNKITNIIEIYKPNQINVHSIGREQEMVELEFMREGEKLCCITFDLRKLDDEMLKVRLCEYPSCQFLESRTLTGERK